MTRATWSPRVLAVAAVAAAMAVFFGATPFFGIPVLVAALWWRSHRRWGPSGAAGIAVLGSFTTTFVAMCLAPALPFPMPVEVAVIHLGVTLAVLLTPEGSPRESVESRQRLGGWDAAAVLSGGLFWVGGVVASHISGRGTGWSWATYIDSANYVWGMRYIVVYGGINTVSVRDARPLEWALPSAGFPLHHPIDSASSTVGTEFGLYALAWTGLVFLVCTLAALVVHEALRHTSVPAVMRRLLAAAVSVSMLLAPVSGVVFYRGQINAHVVWAVVFAAILVLLCGRAHPGATFALLVVATTLAMLSWTVFAPLPGSLAVIALIRWLRSSPGEPGQVDQLVALCSVAFFGWSFTRFTWNDVVGSIAADSRNNELRASYITEFPVPAWLPLTLALLLLILVAAAALRRDHILLSLASVGVAAGVGAGLVYFAYIGGLAMAPDTYYPARFLHMATVCLIPLAVGGVAAALAAAGGMLRVAVATTAGITAVLLVVAPLNPQVLRFGLAPVDFATGRWYGSHDRVFDRIVDYADDDVARLAWRSDPPYDFIVNRALAIIEPRANRGIFLSWFRGAVRDNYRDHSTLRACEIGATSERPVVFVTRDPGLAQDIALACPEYGITVELLTR